LESVPAPHKREILTEDAPWATPGGVPAFFTRPFSALLRFLHFPHPVSYAEGLRLQEMHVEAILSGSGEETVLLLEHEPVYTIGRLRDQSSLRGAATLPHPVFETNRGGQATYHGPGQLVGYPILDLAPRGRDLHAHLRLLEESLIRACAAFGVAAARREGLTGVWVEDRKLASIGVGVRKWVSMHGFAINITRESLPPFLAITPCGLDGVRMTCLEAEAGTPIRMEDAVRVVTDELRELLG
jgi:lipoyl(octanoyl) transferase